MRKSIESYEEWAKRILKNEGVSGCTELVYFILERSPSIRKAVKSWKWGAK